MANVKINITTNIAVGENIVNTGLHLYQHFKFTSNYRWKCGEKIRKKKT